MCVSVCVKVMAKAVSSLEVKHSVKTADLNVSNGAAVGLVLKCDNATTGHASWQTESGGGGGGGDLVLEVETVTTTPYTVTNTAVMSEVVAGPTTVDFDITLPVISGRRLLSVRNISATKSVILHSSGTDTIWTSALTQLTLPPNSVTSFEGASGQWFAN